MKRQREVQRGGNRIHNSHRRLIGLALLGLLLFPAMATAETWTGLGGDDFWATLGNWINDSSTVRTFTSQDSPGTNVVDGVFTIPGLQYLGNSNHTTDFFMAGVLQVNGPIYVGHGGSTNGATVSWINEGSAVANILSIALNDTSAGTNTSLLSVGGPSLALHLGELNVGHNASTAGIAIGTLRWDQADPLDVTNVYFGRGPSTGILEVPAGGTFRLGTATDPLALLGISYHDTGVSHWSGGASAAHLDFRGTDPTFEAFVADDLTIGGKMSGYGRGTADGSLILGSHSSLHVGTVATPGVVNIGMNQSTYADYGGTSGGDGTGLLDATQGAVDLHLSELNVGRHTGYYGTATGTLRWDQADPLDVTNVYFGRGPSTGILEVPAGGTFRLGTATDPLALLGISYHDTGVSHWSGGASAAHLDFRGTDPTFEAFVADDLTIGGKMSGYGRGTADGSLILGSHSSLHVGTVATPGVVNIGMNQSTYADYGGTSGGDGTGLLDATQGAVDLHLSELNVGRHTGYYGTATGTLRWDQADPLDVTNVYFGRGPSTGILEVPAGGTFRLGTATDPLALLGISYHDTGVSHWSGGASAAHLDFRGTDPTFEAFVADDLTIGGKMSGYGRGTADGSLILGSHSSLHVGTVATPGVVNIGMNQSTYADYGGTSGGDGTGLLDATQGAVDLHLSELNVGRHTGYYGTATGTLRWDQADPLDVTNVYFGRGPSTGILEVPAGGTFRLGTATDPLALLGISYHDTGVSHWSGGASAAHLDFRGTDPTFEAFVADDLTIGGKMSGYGRGTADGSLILGSHSSLHVGTVATPGVVNIGMNQSTYADYGGTSGGDGTGLLDATQGAVDLHLSELNVGRHTGYYGTATGTLRWDQADPLDVTNVYFGRGPSTGILEVPAGGTFRLGTATDPLALLGISYHDTGVSHWSGGASAAHLDFRGTDPTFEAFVADDLTIGGKMSGYGRGTADGSLILGSHSSLHVGTVATPGVVNIGMNQSTYADYGGTSGGDGTGLLDATQGAVDLHLSELNVGRHTGYYGTATGTLRWDQADPLDVTNVYFGRGPSTGILEVPAGGTFRLGTATDPLALLGISYHDTGVSHWSGGASAAHLDFRGTDPTFEAFVADDLTIGGKMSGYGRGTADGSLILGSHSSLHVGTVATPGVVNIGMNQSTYADYGGTSGGDGTGLLDATQGAVDLHLSELNVGRHRGYYGSTTGTFTTGDGSVVTMATGNVGTTSGGTATGMVNLQGGRFSANTVNMGSSADFNFLRGRLAVNTFNTYNRVGTLLQEGGVLAPGFSLSDRLDTSLPGFSVINGDYVMENGLLEIELFGTTARAAYDQLQVNGEVNLDGGALDLVLHFAPADGDEFVIIENDDVGGIVDAVQGRFAGLPQGASFLEMYGGLRYPFWINYYGLTGNDVVLRAGPPENVPVPGAIILGGIGVGLVRWLRRRRVV